MSTCIVRAFYSETTIRVYQAYSPMIAMPALAAGRFVAPFKMERMTWIKPSFNWMMYRCGYASKSGQEMVLAIDIRREGFDWALRHAVLSRYQPGIHASFEAWKRELNAKPVRVQWDPERDWRLQPVAGVRAIQFTNGSWRSKMSRRLRMQSVRRPGVTHCRPGYPASVSGLIRWMQTWQLPSVSIDERGTAGTNPSGIAL